MIIPYTELIICYICYQGCYHGRYTIIYDVAPSTRLQKLQVDSAISALCTYTTTISSCSQSMIRSMHAHDPPRCSDPEAVLAVMNYGLFPHVKPHVLYLTLSGYNQTTLCYHGGRPCVDFMDVIMGDIPYRAVIFRGYRPGSLESCDDPGLGLTVLHGSSF